MNKLEQICIDLKEGLANSQDTIHTHDDWTPNLQEWSYDRILVAYLATLVELGEYVISDCFKHSLDGLISQIVDPLSAHNEFIALSKRVSALVTDHGSRPYE